MAQEVFVRVTGRGILATSRIFGKAFSAKLSDELPIGVNKILELRPIDAVSPLQVIAAIGIPRESTDDSEVIIVMPQPDLGPQAPDEVVATLRKRGDTFENEEFRVTYIGQPEY